MICQAIRAAKPFMTPACSYRRLLPPRQGIKVMLLEKAHEIGEIGAGIQLGPNAFSALDSLGVGDVARQRAVFTDHITMMDAVNAEEVVRIETGQAFRDHFGGPYAVIHRVDIHATV